MEASKPSGWSSILDLCEMYIRAICLHVIYLTLWISIECNITYISVSYSISINLGTHCGIWNSWSLKLIISFPVCVGAYITTNGSNYRRLQWQCHHLLEYNSSSQSVLWVTINYIRLPVLLEYVGGSGSVGTWYLKSFSIQFLLNLSLTNETKVIIVNCSLDYLYAVEHTVCWGTGVRVKCCRVCGPVLLCVVLPINKWMPLSVYSNGAWLW